MFGLAMVRVEADEDVVFLGEAVRGFGKDDGADGGAADAGAGGEFAAAEETWMMPSLLASAKARRAPLMTSMVVTFTAG